MRPNWILWKPCAMNKIILQTQNLHKVYSTGRSDSLEVLKGIDLAIAGGEIITIIGPSGVGKSTLLHLIGGLDRPSQGRVLIDGEDISDYDDTRLAGFRNRTIGFVFQFHHLLPEFTALENVMMPGLIAGHDKPGPAGAGPGAARPRRAQRTRQTPPQGTLRWQTAAGGGGARPYQPPPPPSG